MDPLTHITTGALSAQAVRRPLRDRFIFLFCILAAILPDIDNVVGMFGHEAYLIHHRGITHSLLGGILLAGLLTGIFKLLVKPFSFLRGLILSYALILGHIFLDLITTYGTQIFNPFTTTRYTIACVFIIDPIFTLVMAYILYRSFRTPQKRRTIAMLGLAWMIAYPIFNVNIRYAFRQYLEFTLEQNGVAFEQVHVSPDVLAPIFWKVIVEDETSYQMGSLSLFSPTRPLNFTRYTKADQQLFEKFGQQASMFTTYAWFTDYPIMKNEQDGAKTRITFGDLRFLSNLKFMQRVMPNGDPPFSLTAVIDEHQNLVEYSYSEPGGTIIIKHLE